jgi:hypothetical protein
VLVKKTMRIISYFFIISLFLLSNCQKKDPVTGSNENFEPELKKRLEQARDKDGGIFGNIGKGSKDQSSVDFKSSNVLWRATLKSLEFLPLMNVDYSGGVIIYDWYSNPDKPSEQIKISVQFLNNELRSDSIKIVAHKKNCENINKCSNLEVDQQFALSVKEGIINTARLLKIEESKKEKK